MARQWIFFGKTSPFFTSPWRHLFCLPCHFSGLCMSLWRNWRAFWGVFPAPTVENTGDGLMTLCNQVSPKRSAQLCSWDAGHPSCSDLLFPSFHQLDYWCAPLSHIPLRARLGTVCCFPPWSCSSSSSGTCLWWDCSGLGWKVHAQD